VRRLAPDIAWKVQRLKRPMVLEGFTIALGTATCKDQWQMAWCLKDGFSGFVDLLSLRTASSEL
jgi:hypothetical protein